MSALNALILPPTRIMRPLAHRCHVSEVSTAEHVRRDGPCRDSDFFLCGAVESDSTVQLGGFERKSTYNASRAKFLGHRDGGGATDGGGHRSADVSGDDFGTLSVSASQSIMVQADSAHVDMTCSVSNISTVSTTAGGQVGDSLDTSHNRHAKEMQGVLDQVTVPH